MFIEADLLPISALQHLVFCERQWALIHLEGIWQENRFTVEGNFLHERADLAETEVRGNLRIARGLRLRSLQLGLVGRADVVEFHKIDETDARDNTRHSCHLEGADGLWQPEPVEYKRGKPKDNRSDEVQLCAQALCLEEMLTVSIPSGSLYYGKPHRRYEVSFDNSLRDETEQLIERLHELTNIGETPQVGYEKKCRNCSLVEHCMPKVTGSHRSAYDYLNKTIEEMVKG